MATNSNNAKKLIDLYTDNRTFAEVLAGIRQKSPADLPEAYDIGGNNNYCEDEKQARLHHLEKICGREPEYLTGKKQVHDPRYYKGNVENFIGLTQVPTGITGPLYINGTVAQGDYYIPMATTEGALVASYNRGARATRLCGGVTSVCTTEGVQRTPLWKFDSLVDVGQFIFWLLNQMDVLKGIVSEHSRYARLEELKLNMEGNHVLSIFEFTCGEAAGQNMITICTDAICKYVVEHSPVKPRKWYVESNYSGDKKATAVSFSTVRGKKVTSEAVVYRNVVKEVLKSTPEDIAAYWQSSVVAASQSGSIGLQGHVANGLTALFMACGQDVASVSEAYVGITRMEVNDNGDLYVTVTLPSLVVGTVGGGTALPTQRECLEILQCTGKGSARKFAEICGAVALTGELSIAAALASGQFSSAHKLYRRKQ
ncbi:MAG: hydroxymethylglutaryl-CoA reductase [Taibaiella sp.]|nr:hydroxymethylglutaryl-CoA reductase [Taibaiella sp.]